MPTGKSNLTDVLESRTERRRYHQAHKPIEEQETIEGHSVRAMYLLTAAADLVREDKVRELRERTFGHVPSNKILRSSITGKSPPDRNVLTPEMLCQRFCFVET